MAQEVLPVLLADVDDVVALLVDARPAGEFLGVGEQAPPLRLQQVDHVQVLALRLGVAALGGQEVDVGVAGVPALRVHVRPALEPQRQLALAGLDAHTGAQRLVLEAAGHVHDHVAARQPALAAAVDVGVGDLTHPHVATHVHVPTAVVGVDLVVVAVRLEGNAGRRAEVDPARHRLAGVRVEHGHVHPVAAAVQQLDPHAAVLGAAALLHLAPADLADGAPALGDVDGGRRRRGDLRVSGA